MGDIICCFLGGCGLSGACSCVCSIAKDEGPLMQMVDDFQTRAVCFGAWMDVCSGRESFLLKSAFHSVQGFLLSKMVLELQSVVTVSRRIHL